MIPADAASGAATVSVLLENLRSVIREARQQALRAVDLVQVRTCWIVGQHIVEFEQGGQSRVAYGKAVLAQVSDQLTAEFGKGFDERNLRNMRAFYATFPNWNALRSELSWTHYRVLLRVDDAAAREWHMNEAAAQNWNTRALERQIRRLYFERLLSNREGDRKALRDEAAEKLEPIQISPREFVRDPVLLEFLGLPGTGKLLESKLEDALLDDYPPFRGGTSRRDRPRATGAGRTDDEWLTAQTPQTKAQVKEIFGIAKTIRELIEERRNRCFDLAERIWNSELRMEVATA